MAFYITFSAMFLFLFAADIPSVSGGNGIKNIARASCSQNTRDLPQCPSKTRTACGFHDNRTFKHGLHFSIWNQATVTSGLSINEGWDTEINSKGARGGSSLYYFVDTSYADISVGSKLHLTGEITNPGIDAVCIRFRYAMNSVGDPPMIRIKNRKSGHSFGKITEMVIGSVENNTGGEWIEANFRSTVWPNSEIIIEFEKTSNVSGVAAIAGVRVTRARNTTTTWPWKTPTAWGRNMTTTTQSVNTTTVQPGTDTSRPQPTMTTDSWNTHMPSTAPTDSIATPSKTSTVPKCPCISNTKTPTTTTTTTTNTPTSTTTTTTTTATAGRTTTTITTIVTTTTTATSSQECP